MATKTTKRFEDIMAKEETCIKHNDVKEEKKSEWFDKFIVVQEKLIKLQKKVELAAASEETKMLSMKMDNLDPDGGNIVQAVHAKMLKSLAAEMAEAKVVEDPATE